MAHPKGGYKNAAGKRVPGVTTIIGRFKDSGGLLYWAFDQGRAAERGEIENLYDKRDEAADIGTTVHEMVEAHLSKAKGPDLSGFGPEALERVSSGFEAYRKWESMTRLKIIEQETSLVSEEHQFGGTFDAIGEIDGELCLIDWKTSKGVYGDMLCQLAAYNILWKEHHPDRPLTGGFHLCKFSKEHGDFGHHYWPKLDEAEECFILFRRAYDLVKILKARAS